MVIKRRIQPMLGFSKYRTARNTIYGIETMNMIRKGQVVGATKGDIAGQIKFIKGIFHSAA